MLSNRLPARILLYLITGFETGNLFGVALVLVEVAEVVLVREVPMVIEVLILEILVLMQGS